MKIRCDLHLNGKNRKIYLVPRPEEKLDHLALKLAAIAMFFDLNPIVEPSPDHPSLYGFAHRPDACVLDEGGQITHWIECGNVTLHKLDKIIRKLSGGRIIVLKATLREAEKLRKDLTAEVKNSERVEIWAWKDEEFKVWLKAIAEKTEIFGESREESFNLVINEVPYAASLASV